MKYFIYLTSDSNVGVIAEDKLPNTEHFAMEMFESSEEYWKAVSEAKERHGVRVDNKHVKTDNKIHIYLGGMSVPTIHFDKAELYPIPDSFGVKYHCPTCNKQGLRNCGYFDECKNYVATISPKESPTPKAKKPCFIHGNNWDKDCMICYPDIPAAPVEGESDQWYKVANIFMGMNRDNAIATAKELWNLVPKPPKV